MDKIQIKTKKYDERMQRFDLSPNDTTELLTREPLDSAATNLQPGFLTKSRDR